MKAKKVGRPKGSKKQAKIVDEYPSASYDKYLAKLAKPPKSKVKRKYHKKPKFNVYEITYVYYIEDDKYQYRKYIKALDMAEADNLFHADPEKRKDGVEIAEIRIVEKNVK